MHHERGVRWGQSTVSESADAGVGSVHFFFMPLHEKHPEYERVRGVAAADMSKRASDEVEERVATSLLGRREFCGTVLLSCLRSQ